MARLIQIDSKDWKEEILQQKSLEFCRGLENGDILFFPEAPVELPDRKKYARDVFGKFCLKRDNLPGQEFSERVLKFLSNLLRSYSLSPKQGRIDLSAMAKGRLGSNLFSRANPIHLDSSLTQPTHGARILRFFANLSPEKCCRWETSQLFDELLKQFGGEEGVAFPRSAGHFLPLGLERKMDDVLRSSGLQISMRSPYDAFMFRLSRFLKANREFQKGCLKEVWEFGPRSCWAVFTDQVSHSAPVGAQVLEEAFFVPYKTLLYPDRAPVSILERLCDGNMVNPSLANRLRSKAR